MSDPKEEEENRTMSSEEAEEEAEWERLTMAEFLKGYADCDAIYDELQFHPKRFARSQGEGTTEKQP